jgi:hypothetical protein
LGGTEQAVYRSSSLSSRIRAGKQKFFLPKATTRRARSAALLSISKRPSSQKPHRTECHSDGSSGPFCDGH